MAQPYHRVPSTQLDEVKEHLEKLLRTCVIVPSRSDHASPIVLVRKKSGALRMCVDYRTLNAKTIKDAYALPRIVESMDAMTGSKSFRPWICTQHITRCRWNLKISGRQHLQLHSGYTSTNACRSDSVMHQQRSRDSCRLHSMMTYSTFFLYTSMTLSCNQIRLMNN